MKAILVCLLLAGAVLLSSAHHEELCDKQGRQLRSQLRCIQGNISAAANRSFDQAVRALGCRDRSCAIKKLCAGGDLEAAMEEYFPKSEILEIHNAATDCDPHGHQHH
ncbi:antimicrobial peptide microplusin-like [Haemaphysalis longicornis]